MCVCVSSYTLHCRGKNNDAPHGVVKRGWLRRIAGPGKMCSGGGVDVVVVSIACPCSMRMFVSRLNHVGVCVRETNIAYLRCLLVGRRRCQSFKRRDAFKVSFVFDVAVILP